MCIKSDPNLRSWNFTMYSKVFTSWVCSDSLIQWTFFRPCDVPKLVLGYTEMNETRVLLLRRFNILLYYCTAFCHFAIFWPTKMAISCGSTYSYYVVLQWSIIRRISEPHRNSISVTRPFLLSVPPFPSLILLNIKPVLKIKPWVCWPQKQFPSS